MSEDLKVVCPHCGSDRIRSVDTVITTNEVTGWERDANGGLVPTGYDNGETWWDSSEAHPTHPYDCADCGAEFKDTSELKVVEAEDDEEDGDPPDEGPR